jgi:hypothetical protein
MKKTKTLYFGLLLMASSFCSCISVESYQKMYVNDPDMECIDGPLESFEYSFQAYREGASGANGGSVGGGCGCN